MAARLSSMWELWRARTDTGELLGPVPCPEVSWSVSVRDSRATGVQYGTGESGVSGIRLPIQALMDAGVVGDRPGWQGDLVAAFEPWNVSLVLLYGGIPVVAGPIAADLQFTEDSVGVEMGHLGDVLDRRYLTADRYDAGQWWGVGQVSLGGAIMRILKYATRRTGEALPLVYEDRFPEFGDYAQGWAAADVTRDTAWGAIRELVDMPGGPDLIFQPLVSDGRLRYLVRIGDAGSPSLVGARTHRWVHGVHTANAKIRWTFSRVADRSYVVGGGAAGSAIVAGASVHEADRPRVSLSTAVSDTKVLDRAHGERVAIAQLSNRPAAAVEVDWVPSDDYPIHSWGVGDMVRWEVQGHPGVSDGVHNLRVLAVKGSTSGIHSVTLGGLGAAWERRTN